MIWDAGQEALKDLMNREDREEALSWLERGGEKYYLGEMTHEESVDLVKHLYDLGAAQVYVTDIGANAGYASTDTVIVHLPAQRSMREPIFHWSNERAHYMGFDPDTDVGQKYLLVWFD